jgi:hypothetical protein
MTPKIAKLKSKILALQAGLVPLMAELGDAVRKLTAEDILSCAVNAPVKSSTPKASKPRKPAAERKPRGEGLPAKLIAHLASRDPEGFTPDELIGELKIETEKAGQVRTTLSRLLKQGKIASTGKGIYQHKVGV